MKGVTVLKKIHARAKQLRKRHPGKKWSGLILEASRDYRAGKLGRKKKYKVYHRVKKVGRKRRSKRKAHVGTTRTIVRHTKPKVVTRTRTRTIYKTRRVYGKKTNVGLIVGIGAAVLIGGYMLLKPKTSAPTGYVSVPGSTSSLAVTGNVARDTAAQQLVAYAQAANMGAQALTTLIQTINSLGDSQVISTAAQVNAGGSGNVGPIVVQPPAGGPSITLGV